MQIVMDASNSYIEKKNNDLHYKMCIGVDTWITYTWM